jgi:hypothetical protein
MSRRVGHTLEGLGRTRRHGNWFEHSEGGDEEFAQAFDFRVTRANSQRKRDRLRRAIMDVPASKLGFL